MIKFFKRLWFVLIYKEEIEELLEKVKEEKAERKRIARKEYVNLCVRHQPRSPGSHYSEHNCDVCILQAKLEEQAK